MGDQRLFSVGKVGLFCDGFQPGKEKRREETVTIIKATFRLQPFDAKLAAAIDDGLNDNSGVRAALFKLSSPEPKPHLDRVNFSLSCPRQNLEMFASPDTDASRIAFLQVKIGNVYARTQKDVDGYALIFTGSFGPVGRAELEFLTAWYQTQRFVSFEASEPSLEFEAAEDTGDDDEPDEPEAQPSLGEEVAAAKTTDRKREKGHRYPKAKKKTAKKGRR